MTAVATSGPIEGGEHNEHTDAGGRRVLFIGMGATPVAWYRCFMPALFLGADWIGVIGRPTKLRPVTGLVNNQSRMPSFEDYPIIVIQQPRGREWAALIRGMQERGAQVLFEVDDYLHGIPKMKDHDFSRDFSAADLGELERCMEACDGIICSTEYIARKYARFNERVWVCENGIDTARYRLTRPERPLVNIGWAGGTGHVRSAVPWVREAYVALGERDHTGFVSVGQNFAETFVPRYGHERAISVPWCAIEEYPAAMTLFDIALAPAATSGRARSFFKGKSDLRWLEASALGIPVIAEPSVYRHIEHGVTGFHASSPQEVLELLLRLVDDPSLRLEVGARAKQHVEEHRDIRVAVDQWARVFDEVTA
jgi:glycosyltransferase involved in cell wall biosynthesis